MRGKVALRLAGECRVTIVTGHASTLFELVGVLGEAVAACGLGQGRDAVGVVAVGEGALSGGGDDADGVAGAVVDVQGLQSRGGAKQEGFPGGGVVFDVDGDRVFVDLFNDGLALGVGASAGGAGLCCGAQLGGPGVGGAAAPKPTAKTSPNVTVPARDLRPSRPQCLVEETGGRKFYWTWSSPKTEALVMGHVYSHRYQMTREAAQIVFLSVLTITTAFTQLPTTAAAEGPARSMARLRAAPGNSKQRESAPATSASY